MVQRSGIGVDATGGPVIDPTANVIALNEAANKRQDDLRKLSRELFDSHVLHLKEIVELHARYSRELAIKESERLDSIRQVDVLAGNTAADRALVAIQTLATSQAAAAETLRSMVTTTASTIAAQTSETVAGLTNRIAQLEKSSYEGAGKGAGAKNTVTYAIIAVGLLVSLITIGGTVIAIAFAIKR